MVDREARQRAAAAMRWYRDATPAEWELGLKLEYHDAVADAVARDGTTRALNEGLGFWRRRAAPRPSDPWWWGLVTRAALFLESGLEYEWPRVPRRGCANVAMTVLCVAAGVLAFVAAVTEFWKIAGAAAAVLAAGLWGLVLFGRQDAARERRFWEAGEEDLWPFLRRTDYEKAKAGAPREAARLSAAEAAPRPRPALTETCIPWWAVLPVGVLCVAVLFVAAMGAGRVMAAVISLVDHASAWAHRLWAHGPGR